MVMMMMTMMMMTTCQQVAHHVVHLALLRPNREAFVELFLEHGLMIHAYLNHKRLHNLFENPADKDFFVTVCLEGVLGKTVVSVSDNYLYFWRDLWTKP